MRGSPITSVHLYRNLPLEALHTHHNTSLSQGDTIIASAQETGSGGKMVSSAGAEQII